MKRVASSLAGSAYAKAHDAGGSVHPAGVWGGICGLVIWHAGVLGQRMLAAALPTRPSRPQAVICISLHKPA